MSDNDYKVTVVLPKDLQAKTDNPKATIRTMWGAAIEQARHGTPVPVPQAMAEPTELHSESLDAIIRGLNPDVDVKAVYDRLSRLFEVGKKSRPTLVGIVDGVYKAQG